MRGSLIAPMRRSRREARRAYDRLSRLYDIVEGPLVDRVRVRAVASLPVEAGDLVLDIGCGTGRALVPLVRRARGDGSVVGLDLSEGMLSMATRRLGRHDQARRAELVQADAVALPVADHRVDVVFMSFTLELFSRDDMGRVLAECRRVLRPGGRLGVVSLATSRRPSLAERLYLLMHRHFERYVDCRPIPVRELVAAGGFRIASFHRDSMFGLPVETVVART